MNCADVRRRLLLSERPDKPGPEESRHLSGCSVCHGWLRRLVRLERKITELTVPACPVPAGLLEQIAESDEVPLVRPPRQPSAATRSVREVGRQKLALASALAATLALFTLAWWAWPPREPTVATPWRPQIERLVGAAKTPLQRVEAFERVSDVLLVAAQEHADNHRQVSQVADDFEAGVGELLAVVRRMSPGDQDQALPKIAKSVREAKGRAVTLAAEWEARRPGAAKAVSRIVESARKAEEELVRLRPA